MLNHIFCFKIKWLFYSHLIKIKTKENIPSYEKLQHSYDTLLLPVEYYSKDVLPVTW